VTNSGVPRAEETDDPLGAAADDLARALRRNVIEAMKALDRLHDFRANRSAGLEYEDLIAAPVERSVAEILSESQEQLALAGARFRRAAARMMTQQGVSQSDIARRFGVSRQRIAALLSDEGDAGDD
jgi:predicted XRE-type DNA-binding protein